MGLVLFARDYHVGWGNVIILRHAYRENGETRFVDSLYGHLDQILVAEGALVKRGQQIGTIGNNHGMYDAHLHFEMRKNLAIGMNRSAFPRDYSCYFDPTGFVEAHRSLEGAGEIAQAPVNTFACPGAPVPDAPPVYAGPLTFPVQVASKSGPRAPALKPSASSNNNNPRGPFVIDRYSDMRH